MAEIRYCGCGCGEAVTRRYKPGHDARHKSALAQALQGGTLRTRTTAAQTLADLGWAGFADPALLRSIPWVTRRGRPIPLVEDVQRWQVDHLGMHHAHRTCSTLTRNARSANGINRITRLASDSYVTYIEATPDLAARLPHSWDQCTECTADVDRLTHAEYQLVTREATWAGDLTPKAPTRPTPAWQVLADDESGNLRTYYRHPVTGKATPQATWDAPTTPPLEIQAA